MYISESLPFEDSIIFLTNNYPKKLARNTSFKLKPKLSLYEIKINKKIKFTCTIKLGKIFFFSSTV